MPAQCEWEVLGWILSVGDAGEVVCGVVPAVKLCVRGAWGGALMVVVLGSAAGGTEWATGMNCAVESQRVL